MALADRFWQSPESWRLQRRAHRLRTIRIFIEEGVERKGRRGKQTAISFQRSVYEAMKNQGRRASRGPIALDLHFTTRRKNPPAIHSTAKHILDLLGRADLQEAGIRRRSLLYEDDRQVKMLYVGLDQTWDPNAGHAFAATGSTYITVRSLREVSEDLSIAHELQDSQYGRDRYDEDSNPFWCPEPPDPEDNLQDSGFAEARLLADWSRYHQLQHAQHTILERTDAMLTSALTMNASLRASPNPAHPVSKDTHLSALLQENREHTRKLLLSDPLGVPLPTLPQIHGERELFLQAVRAHLKDFLTNRPFFQPLTVPVKVTFLVVPPKQGKDLDNIALMILPILHQVLKPHIAPHLLAPTLDSPGQRSRTRRGTPTAAIPQRPERVILPSNRITSL